MELSRQVTDRIEKLAEAELEDAFRDYRDQAIAGAERISGESINNLDEVVPLLKQAFDRGIAADRLAELLAQSI